MNNDVTTLYYATAPQWARASQFTRFLDDDADDDDDDDDDDDNNNKLQMGRHPVAVIILHVTFALAMKVDYSRFS
jgi:hypothetical protein